MSLLLDTHAFLWWIADDPRLSHGARAALSDSDREVFFSAASAWEMAIKARLGKLRVADDLSRFVTDQLATNGFRVLPVALAHALDVHALPAHHRDPFDRLLVAQCRVENLRLVSGDSKLAPYDIEIIW